MILNTQTLDMYRTLQRGAPTPRRGHAQRRRARIMAEAARRHGLTVQQMLADGQRKAQTNARHDAIVAMDAARFSDRFIAHGMRRSPNYVRFVLWNNRKQKESHG